MEIDPDIFYFLKFWKSNNESILVNTSGSTGKPKKIVIQKKSLINSAKATLDYFEILNNSKFHCCLPAKYIGGKMMLIRALINNGEIILTKPSRNVARNLDIKIDFSAMTPMQVKYSINENGFKNIKKLIIGGGSLSYQLEKKLIKNSNKYYHTYGMTETLSHIAVRPINSLVNNLEYNCLNHVEIKTNKNGNLVVKSPKLGIISLTTNDVVQITGYHKFKYIGRSDNVINTGGIKVHPEILEKEIEKKLKSKDFFIDKIKDEVLGEKVILIALKSLKINIIQKVLKNISDKKIAPKLVLFTENFHLTENGKILRKKTKLESLKKGNLISVNG